MSQHTLAPQQLHILNTRYAATTQPVHDVSKSSAKNMIQPKNKKGRLVAPFSLSTG
ncbi:hypothetical protein AH4AK4_1737 [Aeromonas hydrophila 4AK4]|nr:hypothetical protein AH4AK4_1737 [Aeromonas hydrophila 4AK4]